MFPIAVTFGLCTMTEFNLPSWDCAAALANDEADLYSVAVPDGKYSMRRHPLAKDGLIGLPLPLEPEVTTLPKLLQRAGRKFANRKGFGWRIKNSDGSWGPYEFITFQQFVNRATAFGAGLRAMCPWLNDQDRVGVYGKNELNWAVAQHGIYHQNLTVVPIYDTFGEEAVKYIIEHAELSVVVVSKANLSALAHTVEGMDVVKMIVLFDFPEGKDAPPFTRLLSVPEIMSHGEKVMHDASAPEVRPEGVCLIMYTSGTTGPPKGVVLTHANMMAALAGTLHGLASEVTCDDVHISYLPLAHALENALHMVALARGCAVGFYKGDPRTLVDDVAALRPTLFAGVPRVYQRIHSLVLQKFQAKPWPLRQLIAKALRDQADACRRREGRSCLWDALVFRKVKAALGGRVRLFVTGSAPLSPVLQEFIQVCFGCPVHEGYGLTETSGVSHLCDPRDMNIGHVGGPMVSCEMRLESVPDMNYSTDDLPCPRGEVLLRGPSIMNGYYKSPGLTAEVLDEDGWLHTGDIGRFNRNGSLSIIDRKKNMFKLSQVCNTGGHWF